jgi:hypothetical protein
MKNILGASCLVAGVVLLMWGRNLAYSLPSAVRYVFTGLPGDRSMYLMIGGGGLIAVGLYWLWKLK